MRSDVDIAIVGYGPVGQALAILLGEAGHSVAAFERYEEIYRLPRAVHIDHEIMRILQALGVADELADELVPLAEYQWFGADGEPLMTLTPQRPAVSAWEPDYLFFQPEVERALDRRARACAGVSVHRGWTADGLETDDDGVELTVRNDDEVRTVRARWLVGADGANSFVREAAGITRRDLGFQERWLVVDAEPADMASLAELPMACQWCDPRRPTTHVQSGPRHHRWEFMLLPGEDTAELEDPDRVRSLLEPWLRPGEGELTRSTVYEFRSMIAERMRAGRVLIVGDAAHLTPPFLGQGLCAGLRDSLNLAWKLDSVMRGTAPEALLDTIETERQPHTEWVIRFAIELGKVLCELDPDAAAERDVAIRGLDEPPPVEFPPLEQGVVRSREHDPLAGTLGVQGVVESDGRAGRFDDVVGRGWALVSLDDEPLAALGDRERAALAAVGAAVVSLQPGAPGAAADADGRLTDWLRASGRDAVLVRPDFYVFGSAASRDDLPQLISDLEAHLALEPTPTGGAK